MAAALRPAPAPSDRGSGARRWPGHWSRTCAAASSADAFSRGRYATDASIYQIMPLAVAFPRDADDVAAALAIAAEHDVPVIARGGGTSQNGQPIGAGLVLDFSRHFNGLVALDPDALTAEVRPGMVLERLNAPAAPARPVLPGGALDRQPLHPRRHGRQQLLRRPLARLRQDGRQRPRHRRPAGRRHAHPLRRRDPPEHPRPRRAACCALAEAERAEIDGAVPARAAPGRRLQPRRAAARPSRTSRSCWSAPRARSRSRPRSRLRLSPLPAHRVDGRLPLPELPRRAGDDAAPRGAGPDRGRARRPATS